MRVFLIFITIRSGLKMNKVNIHLGRKGVNLGIKLSINRRDFFIIIAKEWYKNKPPFFLPSAYSINKGLNDIYSPIKWTKKRCKHG